jgi:hypothetical protein
LILSDCGLVVAAPGGEVRRASGVGKKKKSVIGESPPIADADADAAPPRDHIMAQKNDAEVRGGEVVVTPAVLLTRVVVVV